MLPRMYGTSRAALVGGFAAIYLIWGSTYLAIRIGVAEIPPFFMASVRFLVGGMVFIAWARYRGAETPSARDWMTTAIIGVLMAFGGNGLVTVALQTVPSGIGALLVSMVPFWVVIADWARPHGVRPSGRVTLGLILGFVGVALLINPTDVSDTREINVFGAGTIVVATMLWALGSVYSRYAPQPRSQALSSGMQMFGGGVVLMALSMAAGELSDISLTISSEALGAWIYVSVFGTIAYGSYLWLLKATSPAKVATYAYVNPVIALLLGYLVLGESLSSWTMGCSVLVLVAVLMVVTK